MPAKPIQICQTQHGEHIITSVLLDDGRIFERIDTGSGQWTEITGPWVQPPEPVEQYSTETLHEKTRDMVWKSQQLERVGKR